MAWDKGFNFRSTSGYVTDGANETYVLSEAYSVTRNAVTFGWEQLPQAGGANRNNTFDRRIAGINYIPNVSTPKAFRVDLPATGLYEVHLALGDTSVQSEQKVVFQDTNTVLASVNKGAGNAGSHYFDANGTDLTNTTWPTTESKLLLNFSTKIFRAVIGGTSGVTSTTIAHVRLVQVQTLYRNRRLSLGAGLLRTRRTA